MYPQTYVCNNALLCYQVFYLNCVRLLCKHGAHTNCSSRSNLTPLHVLVFTASENIALNREEEKAQVSLHVLLFECWLCLAAFASLCESVWHDVTLYILQAFAFIRQLLVILLQHGLDPNVRFSQRTQHILLSLMDMVQNARSPSDLDHVYALTLTLLQYRADPNVHIATTSVWSRN